MRKVLGALLIVAIAGACSSSAPKASEQTASTEASSNSEASTKTTTLPKADPDDLEEAAKTAIDLRAKGQNGPAWDLLVPQQQKAIPRTKFIDCGDASAAIEVQSVSVEDAYDEEVVIPGTSVTTTSKAVTVKLSYSVDGQDHTETTTIHLIDVRGQWRWMLNKDGVSKCVS